MYLQESCSIVPLRPGVRFLLLSKHTGADRCRWRTLFFSLVDVSQCVLLRGHDGPRKGRQTLSLLVDHLPRPRVPVVVHVVLDAHADLDGGLAEPGAHVSRLFRRDSVPNLLRPSQGVKLFSGNVVGLRDGDVGHVLEQPELPLDHRLSRQCYPRLLDPLRPVRIPVLVPGRFQYDPRPGQLPRVVVEEAFS